MKQSTSAAISLLLGLLAGTTKVAARDDVTVEEGEIEFDVRRFDDGRNKPYELKFWEKDVKTSKYKFSDDGLVTWFKTGTEKYVVRYEDDGSFKKVVRKDSGGRMLLGDERAEEAQLDLEDIDEEHGVSFDHRRLYSCVDCAETWNLVCNVGVPTICDLVGNDVIGTNGDASVLIACETFGAACSRLLGDEACESQCTQEDDCNPNPCLNGGSCELDIGGGHVCSCPSGYGGMACQTDTSSLSEFYITVQFAGTWTAARQAVFQDAADRWAEVITHVPCGGNSDYPAGQLLITATLAPIDGVGGVLGSAGPEFVWTSCNVRYSSQPVFEQLKRPPVRLYDNRVADSSDRTRKAYQYSRCPVAKPSATAMSPDSLQSSNQMVVECTANNQGKTTISLTGAMTFDIDDIAGMEASGIFEGVILHEMGHVIGVGTLWGACSTCRTDGDSDWKCPGTVGVYNDLLGDSDGTDADIIELDGSAGTACGHFDEVIFTDELMTGYVDSIMYLSKMTAASLDDTGYIVDASKVDSYILPALRSGSGFRVDPDGHRIADVAIDTRIGMMDEDGNVVGHMDSVMMEFY